MLKAAMDPTVFCEAAKREQWLKVKLLSIRVGTVTAFNLATRTNRSVVVDYMMPLNLDKQ